MTPRLTRALNAVSLPWNAFVAAFLYYTLLAVLALGGTSPAVPVVATAYLAPVVMYIVAIANRALHALTGWAVDTAATARIRATH
jgi:hypothetical protein